jgi:hypothetical protein
MVDRTTVPVSPRSVRAPVLANGIRGCEEAKGLKTRAHRPSNVWRSAKAAIPSLDFLRCIAYSSSGSNQSFPLPRKHEQVRVEA